MGELKSRPHSIGQSCYHFIWSPYKRKVMLKNLKLRRVCEGILRMIANQENFIIHEMRVMPDHIHLFVEISPRMSISRAFQLLKGRSSRILRRNFKWYRQFKRVWSKGKFYRSVGNVTSDVIEHYISNCQGNYDYFDVKRKFYIPEQVKLNTY